MQAHQHRISNDGSSVAIHLTSLHFGRAGSGKKAYIQAGLHADEVPGMLVSQALREELTRLEAAGELRGEVILVPAANPIGLAQSLHGVPMGRFDLSTGTNFNRACRHVADELKQSLAGLLGADAELNAALVRRHAHAAISRWQCASDADALKRQLLLLAIDADIVLDLHCDNEAVMHLYTGTPLAAACMPLAALLGARALLVTREAGGEPFDEACSRLWWELAAHVGPAHPLGPGCMAATVELRGERDVDYALARSDAAAIVRYLAHAGVLDAAVGELPAALCEATPLEAVAPLAAPHAGIVVFRQQLGATVEADDVVADLIDPVSGATSALKAGVAGVLFGRTAHRHLLRGMNVCKVAGRESFRAGRLLSM